MESNYSLLISKIDEFIRKFYKNRMIKGILFSLGMILIAFLSVNLLEYFSYFKPGVRTVLFFSFLGLSLASLIFFVIIPSLKLYRIGKVISHEQAAIIIGKHFPDVKDKLLNTLQLKNLEDEGNMNRDLILASINQRAEKLKMIRFSSAIDLKVNKKYIKYPLPPLIILLGILILEPSMITQPYNRIVNYHTVFEKPLRYHIVILNNTLQAEQNSDFRLDIKVLGDEVPDQLWVNTKDAENVMNKNGKVSFSFLFKNLQRDLDFSIKTNEFESKKYTIKVLPRPIVLSYNVLLEYPAYLKKKPEELENSGDMNVPAGTYIQWRFNTKDVKGISVKLGGGKPLTVNCSEGKGMFSVRLKESTTISFKAINDFFGNNDSIYSFINVIPDQYPEIQMEEHKDTLFENKVYWNGVIKDDYGLSKLTFNYIRKKEDSVQANPVVTSEILSINSNLTEQSWFYYFDFLKLNCKPGESIDYYFEVWDNDGVNGSKSTKTGTHSYKMPTNDEIQKDLENKSNSITDNMEDLIRQSNKVDKEIEAFKKSLIDTKSIGWQEKKQLDDLLNKQKEISERVEALKKANELKNTKEELYKENSNKDLIEKTKELEKLFNEILPEDLKKMFEELQKLMDKVDKDKIKETLDKLKMTNEDTRKQLDRDLELYRQLEVEKKLQDIIDKSSQLSNDQKKVSENAENKAKDDTQKSAVEQKDLNNRFDNLKEDLKELEKKNSELENKNELENNSELENEIDQKMEDALDKLGKKNAKEGAKSGREAAGKMDQLGKKLDQDLQKMQSESAEEDEEALRKILENLLRISFAQEQLISDVNNTSTSNPKYIKLIETQKDLNDDIRMVEDSLQSLGKRQMSVAPFIGREINKIKYNSTQAVEALNQRNLSNAKTTQQFVMTSVNNLAVMLSEVLQKMQNENDSQGAKGGMKIKGKKPGSGSEQMKSLRQLQEQLGKQLKGMKEGNEQKPGSSRKMKQSEELARMVAQQEAIRKRLQELSEELQKEGSGLEKQMNEIMKDIDQSESDMINKKISPITIERQQRIETRMLESEKALLKQEQENRRESNEGKQFNNIMDTNFIQFYKSQSKKTDVLKTVTPSLNPFYRLKSDRYFRILD